MKSQIVAIRKRLGAQAVVVEPLRVLQGGVAVLDRCRQVAHQHGHERQVQLY